MQILKCPVYGKKPKFRLGGYGVGQYRIVIFIVSHF